MAHSPRPHTAFHALSHTDIPCTTHGGGGAKAAPAMRRKQGDRRRIVLLPVTVKDIPQ